MSEVWASIDGYPGYEVSNMGRVRSFLNKKHKITTSSKLLSLRIDHRGYNFVNLYDMKGRMKSFKVHRLAALAFIPNPLNLPCVNHLDENKFNNKIENLEWCTHIYNVNYGTGIKRSSLARRTCKVKPILQFDLDGNLLNEFYSLSEASRQLNISLSSISDCLSGRTNKSRNFIFKYKKDEQKTIVQ